MTPEYVILSDADNVIKYNEVYAKEVNRLEVANNRERLESLKVQRADIEAQIAELEALIEQEELIVKLADEKKAQEENANENAGEPVVEGFVG